jgi:hypothetical protein
MEKSRSRGFLFLGDAGLGVSAGSPVMAARGLDRGLARMDVAARHFSGWARKLKALRRLGRDARVAIADDRCARIRVNWLPPARHPDSRGAGK